MKECPHCHKDLPDDSTFCIYCGRPIEKVKMKDLEKAEKNIEKEMRKSQSSLKANPKANNWGKIGITLFLFALIVLDCIVGTIVNSIDGPTKIVFIISFVFYVLAMICGVMSLVTDYKDKKKGFEQNGSYGFAIVSIAMSIYIALLNLTSVILK